MLSHRLGILARHNSVLAMFLIFLGGWGIVIANSDWLALALAPIGIGAQMFNEYASHRFIFHQTPPKSQFWFNRLYELHYGHHDFPSAEKLFFVPIWYAVPTAFLNFLVFWAGTSLLGLQAPWTAAAAIVFIGGVGTFLLYEWFHMTAHLSIPKSWVEQYVSRLHTQHHFRNFNRWYHVSPGGEVIDRVLGTAISAEELKQQSRIEFITTLGLRPDDPRFVKARDVVARRKGVDPEAIERASKRGQAERAHEYPPPV